MKQHEKCHRVLSMRTQTCKKTSICWRCFVAANTVENSSVASFERVDGMMEQIKVVQSQVEAFVRRLKG